MVIDHDIDARGLLCPLPVLLFKKQIKALGRGSIVKITTTDPDSVSDFDAFTKMKGYTMISCKEFTDHFVIVIEV